MIEERPGFPGALRVDSRGAPPQVQRGAYLPVSCGVVAGSSFFC
jgi:hypothetical protein